jgi:hypothetical protein
MSTNRSAGNKLEIPRMPPPMNVDWLDSGSWRLPSGKALAEFALQAGFLAPLLFRVERFGRDRERGPLGAVPEARSKGFQKGSSQ